VSNDVRVNRLYQWLSERASFFGREGITSRTVRTEVTVERQGMTLLVGGVAINDIDICPLCGQKLARTKAEPGKTPPSDGSDLPGRLTIDGTSS
jgi:hypothetical protein